MEQDIIQGFGLKHRHVPRSILQIKDEVFQDHEVQEHAGQEHEVQEHAGQEHEAQGHEVQEDEDEDEGIGNDTSFNISEIDVEAEVVQGRQENGRIYPNYGRHRQYIQIQCSRFLIVPSI
jgi:hypothetical protein